MIIELKPKYKYTKNWKLRSGLPVTFFNCEYPIALTKEIRGVVKRVRYDNEFGNIIVADMIYNIPEELRYYSLIGFGSDVEGYYATRVCLRSLND